MGRKRATAASQALHNNPGKRSTKKGAAKKKEPTTAQTAQATSDQAAVPAAPKGLPAEASRVWREVAPKLVVAGLLTDLDLGVLRLYCEAWADKLAAEKTLAREGEFFTTEKGYVGIHPAALKRNKALESIRRLGSQLGLSPQARRGLETAAATPGTRQGKLGDYLAARPK